MNYDPLMIRVFLLLICNFIGIWLGLWLLGLTFPAEHPPCQEQHNIRYYQEYLNQ